MCNQAARGAGGVVGQSRPPRAQASCLFVLLGLVVLRYLEDRSCWSNCQLRHLQSTAPPPRILPRKLHSMHHRPRTRTIPHHQRPSRQGGEGRGAPCVRTPRCCGRADGCHSKDNTLIVNDFKRTRHDIERAPLHLLRLQAPLTSCRSLRHVPPPRLSPKASASIEHWGELET